MAGFVSKAITKVAVYAYGMFTVILYGLISVKKGTFFKQRTEKEHLELQLARDRLWNLGKEFWGLAHHILTLPSGFKFHFVSNQVPGSAEALSSEKPLVVFIHGFPDSWAVWRHIVSKQALQDEATVVAIDLPGYGGTQGLDRYSGTNVMEKLTELIIALRVQYGVDKDGEINKKRVILVAHDWGCVLTMRLAAEAPMLAHRFILSNGPLPSLAASNIRRLLLSAHKMFNTALASPFYGRAPLMQALRTLIPVVRQLSLSGYIFAMQMPLPVVRYFLTGGNCSLMTAVHKGSHGRGPFTLIDAAESMASSMGPSLAESKTETASGDAYPTTIKYDIEFANVLHPAAYYRDGAASGRWQKSIETVASLHGISGNNELRRTSSGAGLFDEAAPGVLNASATVFWGKKDIALEPSICLDGMGDYLVKDSQVILLPESGHFTPIEPESREALMSAVQWAVHGEKEDVAAAVQRTYPSAKVIARR